MKALKMLKLDLLTMKPQALGNFLVMLGMSLYFLHMSPSVPFFGAVMFAAVFGIGVYQVEYKNNLRKFYGALPMKVEDIVLGRYLYLVMNFLLAVFIIMFVTGVEIFLGYEGISTDNFWLNLSLALLAFCLLTGVQVPSYFRFGYSKGRIHSLLIYIGFFFATGLLVGLGWTLDRKVSSLQELTLSALCWVLSFLITFVSYKVSVRLYRFQS